MNGTKAMSGSARRGGNIPGPFGNLIRQRELIRIMAWRNFSARYRGSFGGLFWAVFQPLVMMLIYTLIFSQFLKVKFGSDASPFTYAVYLLGGMLPWNAFSEGMMASAGLIRSHANLVKRVVFPLEVLPVNLALAAALQQLIGFALLAPLVWLMLAQWHWSLLFVPVILLLQLLFAIGMNWLVASLAVYLPDLGQLISLLLTAWMFLTPVFYPEEAAPAWGRALFVINPMARLISLYRNAFMTGLLPSIGGFLGDTALCLAVFLAGYYWFMCTKKGFVDVL